MHTPYGFIAFGVESRRHLVDRARTVAGYCECDTAAILDAPSFVSAFAFPQEMRQHLHATGTTAGYGGPVGVPSLMWDLDRDDLADALRDAARLVDCLHDRYTIDPSALMVGFSGSKGLHLELPIPTGVVEASPYANLTARHLAEEAASEAGVEIDTGIYDKVRLWRLWNTRHLHTHLHKVRLEADDLLMLSPDSVRRLAAHPRDFTPPAPVFSPKLFETLAQAGREVRHRIEQRAEANARRVYSARPLMRHTLDLIRDGCGVGERHRRLFSAAADMARYENVEELVAAILSEPGRDLGLPPREVDRQIACGIRHGRGEPLGGAA
jgi:hypothetical protein